MAKSDWFVNAPASISASAQPPAVPLPSRSKWTLLLIGLTLVAVIGAIVLQIVLMKNASRKNDEDKDRAEKSPLPPPVKKPEEITVRPEVAPGDPKTLPPMLKAEPRKVGRPSVAVQTLIGGLTASHLYQSHLNIGLIADGVGKKVYTAEQGKELLDKICQLMDTVERQLNQLPEEEFQPDEKKWLEKIRSVVSQLRSDCKELKSYWDSGEEADFLRFQKIHKNVSLEVEKLLGGE